MYIALRKIQMGKRLKEYLPMMQIDRMTEGVYV